MQPRSVLSWNTSQRLDHVELAHSLIAQAKLWQSTNERDFSELAVESVIRVEVNGSK